VENRKAYSKPGLVEYGRVTELTLGSSGTKPDYSVGPGNVLTPTNTNCSDPGTTFACLVS
jgi:hypothetical protein